MEQQTLLIDMDHVMADITSNYIKWYKNATGVEMTRAALEGKPEDAAFPQSELVKKFLHSPDFFRTANVMKDSQAVIKELNEHYSIYIVSAAMEFPQSLREKHDWLAEHFPFISWRQMILCGSKKPISGDIMIDDHIKNLDTFDGRKFLFTATHNTKINHSRYTRVNSWAEVGQLLLPAGIASNSAISR